MKRKNSRSLVRKPRSDSYEAGLTPEESDQLYAWLMQPGLSLEETTARAPLWRNGKRAGHPPGQEAVAKIGRRLRIESVLGEVEAAAQVQFAALTRVLQHVPPGTVHEETLDLAMRLISQKAIIMILQDLDPATRTAAIKLMLARSVQNLEREKFKLTVRKYEDATQAALEKSRQAGAAATREGGIPDAVLQQIEKE